MRKPILKSRVICLAFAALAASILHPTFLQAQKALEYTEKKDQAIQLYNENKMVEAAPLFQELAKENDKDVTVFSDLGFALYAISSTTKDPQERKNLADRALATLQHAKELGDKSTLTDVLISNLSGGAPQDRKYSANPDANQAMQDAEIFFVKGDMNGAVDLYQKALVADPKLYDAALYIGDAYYKMPGKMEQAPEWFAKAVAIDPDRETAYRYWADALTKMGRGDEARDKYVDAYISEPRSRLAVTAFVNWAKSNHVSLAHPAINIPSSVTSDDKGNTNITIDSSTLGDKKPGAAAWMLYGISRAAWKGDEFSKAYPSETTYRHSLKEEAEALSVVVSAVTPKERKSKDLDPSLANLISLKNDGVLEPYILLARSDDGIVRDYPAYLKSNRAALRKYVVDWVMNDGHAPSGK